MRHWEVTSTWDRFLLFATIVNSAGHSASSLLPTKCPEGSLTVTSKSPSTNFQNSWPVRTTESIISHTFSEFPTYVWHQVKRGAEEESYENNERQQNRIYIINQSMYSECVGGRECHKLYQIKALQGKEQSGFLDLNGFR